LNFLSCQKDVLSERTKELVLFSGAEKRTKRDIHLSPNLFPIWKRLNLLRPETGLRKSFCKNHKAFALRVIFVFLNRLARSPHPPHCAAIENIPHEEVFRGMQII
jgi:hypothetical protein